MPDTRSWLVLRGGDRIRWGGDLRRRYLFEAFIRRTGARTLESWAPRPVADALGQGWRFWRSGPSVLAADLVRDSTIEVIKGRGVAFAVDLHDEPIAAARAFGVPPGVEEERRLRVLWEANLQAFPNFIVPTAALAQFCRLEPDRTIVAVNGTDTRHVRPLPFPDTPAIGLASAAAPGRGIETLIDAARLVRDEMGEVRLLLWLAASGVAGQGYFDSLRARVSQDPWIELATVPYLDLSAALARAMILCIPHPRNAYFDLALPVKLADYMAAGRPVVVTPCVETARIVLEHDAGVVASGDRSEDLAGALVEVLRDQALAERLGANGRMAAERRFDWQVVGDRLAEELLRRAGS